MKLTLACIALLVPACLFDLDDSDDDAEPDEDPLFHDSITDGPIEGRVAMASNLSPANVRAGLFRCSAPAEIERLDGEILEGFGSIDILVSLEGKAKLVGAGVDAGSLPIEGLAAVRFAPAVDADVDSTRITVDLPEPRRDDCFELLVWYDADDDGMLELGATDSEFARTLGRSFPDDDQGRLFVSSIQSAGDTWKVYAYGGNDEDGYVSNHVSDRELEGWSVTIEAERQ